MCDEKQNDVFERCLCACVLCVIIKREGEGLKGGRGRGRDSREEGRGRRELYREGGRERTRNMQRLFFAYIVKMNTNSFTQPDSSRSHSQLLPG